MQGVGIPEDRLSSDHCGFHQIYTFCPEQLLLHAGEINVKGENNDGISIQINQVRQANTSYRAFGR